MTNFSDVLNKIEDSLTKEIDVTELAKAVYMSVYEFRRIFSFVAGIPLSEYIRKRRLSIAAEDILTNGISVTDAAMKYQYDDPSSFTRAFKEFHGIAPSEISKGKYPLKMYTKLDFQLRVEGGNNVEYRIYQSKEYCIEGVKGFSKIEEKECCESVWENFEKASVYDEIVKSCGDGLYVAYENSQDGVMCSIGRKVKNASAKLDYTTVPSSIWVAFTLHETDDEYVNRYYGDIICRWLNSSMYSRNEDLPNVEVFPADISKEGFAWEIHIPIIKK